MNTTTWKNTSDEAKIFGEHIIHPGAEVELDVVHDEAVAQIKGLERVGGSGTLTVEQEEPGARWLPPIDEADGAPQMRVFDADATEGDPEGTP